MNATRALPPTLRRTAGALIDLVFPPQCLICGAVPDADGIRFCGECERTIARERAQPACPRCAASVAAYEVREGRCSDCRGLRPHVAAMVRVGPYGKLLGHMLRRYKYKDRGDFGTVLSRWLAESVGRAPWLGQVEVVTCVPGHWSRRLIRPTYPAYELATSIARRLDLPFATLIRRTRLGPSQVGLTHAQRVVNVRGAFQVRRGIRFSKANVLIIDDVRTTGATLNECAKVLRRAGADKVFAAVVVRAHPERLASQSLGPI
jgi:ComF family protein